MKRGGRIKYNSDYRRRIRAGFIGCGGHSYRNVFPTFQYAPVELIAVCDLDPERAANAARMFGAQMFYTNYRKMLASERLDAVFVVTDYDSEGKPQYPEIAIDAMNAGCCAWIEKPPASSAAEIRRMMAVEKKTGKFVMVGFKKMFFPAIQELKRIIGTKEFGGVGSISLKYPQPMLPDSKRKSMKNMTWFLDHLVHPASIMRYLMGPVESLFFLRTDLNADSVSAITFKSGAVGTLHLSGGASQTSPLERVEVVGKRANAVVENGVRLTYYRPGSRGEGGYSHGSSFIGKSSHAPIIWEPEFSLGETCNKAIFLLGYVGEVIEFCDCVLAKRRPEVSGLDDALDIMKFYDAFKGQSGKLVRIR